VNINFLRPAPGESRILFGGMTGSHTNSLPDFGARLLRRFQKIMPDFAGIRLAHVWTGQCAGTFDFMPHLAQRGRVWFAAGYNFAGVPMGTYLGMKLAHRIVGSKQGETVFEEKAFPTKAFYRGNPWFVPAAMRYFDLNDFIKARLPGAVKVAS
jgi:glycine/D-amino acid oxidase-like deaminating enzyme